MKWKFKMQPAGMVEQDVTQRDQFSNDDVALSDTIIRESIQNSLDAATNSDGTVRVSYRFITTDDGLNSDFVKELVREQLPHAEDAGLSVDSLDLDSPTALVIEDFGTSGLTGRTGEIDTDNFSDFWRRHGKSHKTGRSRGRWGLGKLVYSTTSEIGVFFGLTQREGEAAEHLMGQTVLNLREHEGRRYPPHAFFADLTSEDPQLGIPVPVRDDDFVQEFKRQFDIKRAGEPGLSLVILFPNQSFSIEQMMGVAVSNYFYPLVTGQLKVQFNDVEIDATNVREFAEKYARDLFPQVDLLFDFIEGASAYESKDVLRLHPSWADDKKLDADDFEPDDLERIRSQFLNEGLIGLELPLSLTSKTGDVLNTSFRVFIQKPSALTAGMDMYVRGGLTVPGEKKFGARKALGAMIAEDESICSFLGDAENAAHTKWIGNAEKLKKNFRSPADRIRVIKNAVVNLYDMLAQDVEEEDDRGLVRFFSTQLQNGTGNKGKRTPPKPKPPVPKPPIKRIALSRFETGFRLKNPDDADASLYPCSIKVRAAYDVIRGNPFTKYVLEDFKFGGRTGIRVDIAGNCELVNAFENRLDLIARDNDFNIIATGFDGERDLLIEVRAEALVDEADT